MTHSESELCDLALCLGLQWGSHAAWRRCLELVFDADVVHPLALRLVAGLGHAEPHERLHDLFDLDTERPALLWALGLSGSVLAMSQIIELVGSEVETEARLAGEAFVTLTGADARALRRAEGPPQKAPPNAELPPATEDAEAQASLPELDDDDLDADLGPKPQDDLPLLDKDLVRAWWQQHQRRFDAKTRYVGGEAHSVGSLVSALSTLSLRQASALGLVLGLRTGGQVQPLPLALTRRQQAWLDRQSRVSGATLRPLLR